MHIWDSETNAKNQVVAIHEDHAFCPIDNENGILRLNDYSLNGMHVTSLLFVGPNSENLAVRWHKFVQNECFDETGDEVGDLDLNCDTTKLIEKFIKLGEDE